MIKGLKQILESGSFDENSLEKAFSEINSNPRLAMRDLSKDQISEFAELGDLVTDYALLDKEPFKNACKKQFAIINLVDLAGRIQYMFGDLKRGIDIRLRAAELFMMHDEKYAADTLDYTSCMLHEIGEKEKAVEARVKAAGIYEKIKDHRSAAYSYGFAGRYCAEMGRFDEAVDYKEKSYELFLMSSKTRPFESRKMRMNGLKELNFAVDYAISNKDFQRAIDILVSTEKPLVEEGHYINAANNLEKASSYLVMAGRLDQGTELINRALGLLKNANGSTNGVLEAKLEYLRNKLAKPL